MARTRGGMIGNQDRGRGRDHSSGRATGRGRRRDVKPNGVRLVEIANVPDRCRMSIGESSPSSASIGNKRGNRPNVCADSLQGNSISAALASIFERIL